MTRLRLSVLLAITLLMVSCATPPKDAMSFSMAALPPPSPDYAVLVVYRQIVFPVAYKSTISVNGQEAVEMPNEGFTWIKVKPGYVLVKNDWSFAAGNPSGAYDLDVAAGQYYYFEITGNTYNPPLQVVEDLHIAAGLVTYHSSVEGRGFVLRDAAVAIRELTTCCRHVPVEDDYVPGKDNANP
ncbi:MAG: DUF2846 domain-containing protein [Gammaproteobacteria bacterium]